MGIYGREIAGKNARKIIEAGRKFQSIHAQSVGLLYLASEAKGIEQRTLAKRIIALGEENCNLTILAQGYEKYARSGINPQYRTEKEGLDDFIRYAYKGLALAKEVAALERTNGEPSRKMGRWMQSMIHQTLSLLVESESEKQKHRELAVSFVSDGGEDARNRKADAVQLIKMKKNELMQVTGERDVVRISQSLRDDLLYGDVGVEFKIQTFHMIVKKCKNVKEGKVRSFTLETAENLIATDGVALYPQSEAYARAFLAQHTIGEQQRTHAERLIKLGTSLNDPKYVVQGRDFYARSYFADFRAAGRNVDKATVFEHLQKGMDEAEKLDDKDKFVMKGRLAFTKSKFVSGREKNSVLEKCLEYARAGGDQLTSRLAQEEINFHQRTRGGQGR